MRALALAAALVLVAAGCDTDRRAISRDDLPEVPEEADVVVTVDEDGFDVAELTVQTDDLLELVFAVEARVTATSPDVTLIDTGTLLPGESTFLVLDVASIYELRTDHRDDVLMITSEAPPEP